MHYEIRLFGIITKKVTVVYTKFKFNVQVFDQRTPISYALAGKGFCVGQEAVIWFTIALIASIRCVRIWRLIYPPSRHDKIKVPFCD